MRRSGARNDQGARNGQVTRALSRSQGLPDRGVRLSHPAGDLHIARRSLIAERSPPCLDAPLRHARSATGRSFGANTPLPLPMERPMTGSDLVRHWFHNLWELGNESTIDECLAPGMVVRGLAEADLVGREQFRAFYRSFRAAFPTIRVNLERVLES